MNLNLPVLVSVDKKEVYQLYVPGLEHPAFRGVSLAELLDDLAIHFMEKVPKTSAEQLAHYPLCPNIQLRKVKITANLKGPGRKKIPWTGRLAVVLSRWPGDKFFIATVPRLSTDTFAIARTGYLQAGLTRFIEKWGEHHQQAELDACTCRPYEYLEIVEVEADAPTILQSRRPGRKKKKKPVKGKSGQSKTEKRKRRLIAPTTLRSIGANLTHRALDGRLLQAFGRDQLLQELSAQIQQPAAALLLVGPSGIGKTAIVHELARRLAQEKRPLHERTDIWEVDGNRFIAGMSMVGAWESRCKDMVHELSERQDILYVNDLPALVYTGRSSHSNTNVAEYLEPHLARGELRIVGECTVERLEAVRDEAPGFFARFRIVPVPELSEKESLIVLLHAARQAEAQEDIFVAPQTLEAILAMGRRFLTHQCHPGKSIRLLRQLLSDHQRVEVDDFGRRCYHKSNLIDFFSRQSGLPRFVLWQEEAQSQHEISAYLKRHIVAQHAAIKAVTDTVCILQQGLNDPERPLATLLFVGPTGVGKTETAKTLARFLFGSADRLLRFDMSEFSDAYAVTRLFGDQYQQHGELTGKVSQQPFAVVLLDEIEKAHPVVFDALLQVLGESRLTNAAGRTVDFCNTAIIMTSNLGVREASRTVGFGKPEVHSMDQHFRHAAQQFFKPEFFNRIDRVVPFRALLRRHMAPLVQHMLRQLLSRRGLRHSNTLVQVDPQLVELLVDEGFDSKYGARSLKRLLEQKLSVPLARHLVGQKPEQTTLIQLFRFGKEIDMEVWTPELGHSKPLEGAKPAQTWEHMERQFEDVAKAHRQLQQTPGLKTLSAEYSGLLERSNHTTLEADQHARLAALGRLWEMLRTLRHDIELFSEEYLASHHYVEDIDTWEVEYDWQTRTHQVAQEVPYPVDRKRILPQARKSLHQLRTVAAETLFFADALERPQAEPMVVRFLPAADTRDSIVWAIHTAINFRHLMWASVELLVRRSRQWVEVSDAFSALDEKTVFEDTERQLETADNALYGADAAALVVTGLDMRPLIQPELGYYQYRGHVGPDLKCDMVRIEEVGHGELKPADQLLALDEALAQFQQKRLAGERLAGERTANPLPLLTVQRVFEEGNCFDVETGLEISQASLAGLREVIMLRLLAQAG